MDKKRIHEMLEKMTEWTLCEMQSKGKEGCDTKELGDAADMVKDLAEAEAAVWKKCYYEKIVKAMEEEEDFEKQLLKQMILEKGEVEGRMGYDRWRSSTGRFARTGHGHETSMAAAGGHHGRMGYDPKMVYHDEMGTWDDNPYVYGAMGYSAGAGVSQGHMGTGTYAGGHAGAAGGSRYGQYQDARRHYHETGSEEHRQAMTHRGQEYVDEAVMTMRDIFQEADPSMQQKMKTDLANLYREFGGK